MPISNMQQPRQMYEYGGLSAPRQNYGLGSFVKKAVRGVKKIAKSPLGKAALIGGLGYGLGGAKFLGGKGIFAGGQGMGRFSNLMNLVKPSYKNFAGDEKSGLLKGLFYDKDDKFSAGRAAMTGLGVASLAPLFMGGGDDEVEESVTQLDPNAAVQSAKNFYSGQGDAGVGLNFMPQKKYVNQNFYAADGGRANYANGQLVTPSGDGSRPGYAGPLDFFKNLKSGFNQIVSGETQSFLGGDQAGMNEATVLKGYGIDLPKETIEMIVNGYKDGADVDTISALSGTDTDTVTGIIDMLNMNIEQPVEAKAYGGRAGYAMGGNIEDEEEFMRSGAGQSRRMPTAFLAMGGGAGEAQAEQMLQAEFIKYKNRGGELSFQQFVQAVMQQQEQGMQQPMMAANGGRMNYAEGGGIMDTEQAEMIDMGGMEKDYRDEGGFVAMGGEERADDVPARLSKNEFVFTADAVRNAGGGDIDRGSEVMQNLMDNLEQGGQVSEDSQGLGGGEEMMSEEMIQEPNGAQAMYEQQQALQSRMI